MPNPDTLTILLGMLAIAVTLGAVILTSLHRSESRLNRRMDDIKNDIVDSETRTRAEIVAVEVRLKEEIVAVEARLKEEIAASEARATVEIKASEARTGAKFEDVREQFVEVNAQLRTTNDRMSSIERQQARLGGLLEGLREALFQRVQQ